MKILILLNEYIDESDQIDREHYYVNGENKGWCQEQFDKMICDRWMNWTMIRENNVLWWDNKESKDNKHVKLELVFYYLHWTL